MSDCGPKHPVHQNSYGVGQRLADKTTGFFGSWKFIVIQTVLVIFWISLNVLGWSLRWDPFPFILLNLLFSTQAAYAAPLILLSQNRQAEIDRIKAEHDYKVNQVALQYLVALHDSIHGPDCTCWRDHAVRIEDMWHEEES